MDWDGLPLLIRDSPSAELSQRRPRPTGSPGRDSGEVYRRDASSKTGANMRQRVAIFCLDVVLALPLANTAFAQNGTDWTEPFPPFRIAGNLYYVGSKGLANYLVTTPQGNILINSDLEPNVPMIEASIEKLGIKFNDSKILLISHAHWDHDAGSAKIKQMTAAR